MYAHVIFFTREPKEEKLITLGPIASLVVIDWVVFFLEFHTLDWPQEALYPDLLYASVIRRRCIPVTNMNFTIGS